MVIEYWKADQVKVAKPALKANPDA
jgi:hypothetical protein